LAEPKFPLNQILRSGIFSWTQEADEAWENIKTMIALDIKLTIPNKDEQLLISTDASKVACSCILWVCRGNDLKVVGCYSKLFSHADSLKNMHFKETYAWCKHSHTSDPTCSTQPKLWLYSQMPAHSFGYPETENTTLLATG
jgi:RNase H-like domain found in reverse transcriptase